MAKLKILSPVQTIPNSGITKASPANKVLVATKPPVKPIVPVVKPVASKAVAAKPAVAPAAAPVEKPKSDSTSKIEKHIKEFEPLELVPELGFSAQKVYKIHNEWARTKPLIEHLGKGLAGKLKAQLAAFTATLDSINPNPGA